jgi:RNA polymerase sigma factor (sigma-70 family)
MSEARLEDDLAALHLASFGWALAVCRGERAEAEDVLQSAYLKVLDGHARFAGGSTFKTWLFAVIRRTAAERRRTRWLRLTALRRWLSGLAEPAPVPDPERLVCGAERMQRLRDSMRILPARQCEILHLVFYQELSLEQAAQAMGVSVGSARTHYHRAKVRLRGLMDAPPDEHA